MLIDPCRYSLRLGYETVILIRVKSTDTLLLRGYLGTYWANQHINILSLHIISAIYDDSLLSCCKFWINWVSIESYNMTLPLNVNLKRTITFSIASNVVGNEVGVWMILTIFKPTVVMSKLSEGNLRSIFPIHIKNCNNDPIG